MNFLLFFFSLIAMPKWSLAEVQLESSGPGTVRPGQNLNLVCKVTGVSITSSSYAWNWVRQPPGKGLEWIARIFPNDGRKWFSSSLQSRTTITSDNAKNEYSLQLNSMSASDMAIYYCAGDPYIPGGISLYFDVWGKGTNVVVTSETPKAPSLFPLIPSGDNSETIDITIGCLAKNFLPDSIDFSWDNQQNQSIGNQNYIKFPSILSSGTYTAVSQAKVPRSTWDEFQLFYCKATHPQGNKIVPVVRQYGGGPPLEPSMLIRAPTLNAFSSIYLNSTVTCEVSDLCSGDVAIRWLKENKEITTGITTSKPVPNGHGGYTISSKVVITKEDWVSEKKFTCEAKRKDTTILSEAFNLLSFCKSSGCLDVTVETIPPAFADIFQTSSANLTCKISNIPVDADYSKLNVTWTRASDQKQLHTVMTNFLSQGNEFYYVNAVATVCATEWKKDETFTCKVTFEDVLVKPIEKTLVKESVGEPKAPSVYVLPPSLEELNLRETVTLTCLIKNFNPGNFFVRWLQNEQPVSESGYFTSKAISESKIQSKEYFAYSMLNISEQEWSTGDSFTCVVGHEALYYSSIQKTVNKNTGKPSIVNVSLVLSDTSTPCY